MMTQLRLHLVSIVLAACLVGGGDVQSQSPSAGEKVIRDAVSMYAGKWFETVTFVQKTTFGDGRVETWYESLRLPGQLRIDFTPMSAGRAAIFRNDSLYGYGQGTLRAARPRTHPLLIALYDLHVRPPEQTSQRLSEAGFDLTKSYRTKWKGSDVVVIGALEGDTVSNQVWLELWRMLAVRVIERGPQGSLLDTHVGGYTAVGNYWHEREVITYRNGALDVKEEYTEVRVNALLPPEVFAPLSTLTRPAWIGDGGVRW